MLNMHARMPTWHDDQNIFLTFNLQESEYICPREATEKKQHDRKFEI